MVLNGEGVKISISIYTKSIYTSIKYIIVVVHQKDYMDKISSPTLVYSRRGEKYRTADNAALQAQYYSLQPNLTNRPKKRNKQFDGKGARH